MGASPFKENLIIIHNMKTMQKELQRMAAGAL